MTLSLPHKDPSTRPEWEGLSYHELNALLNLYDENGRLQFDADKEAARRYFLDHVNPNTVFFHDLEEKIDYLVSNGYYNEEVLNQYDFADIKALTKFAYSKKFRFPTFMGAFKFYSSYALKTFAGDRYLERFEDRVVMNGLALARGDIKLAYRIVEEIITGRYQPATPTFLNTGKKQAGMLISCYLMDIDDSMSAIGKAVSNALYLAKNGGGVALNLSNLREAGAPIKKMKGLGSGVVPVMKLLEDSFSYANQLGQRQGAGVVSLHAHHPDIMTFLDTKRENADEKVRIKTLSLSVVIPDITFELARKNEDMYLFSPYDVEREYGKPFSYINVTEEYQVMVDNPRITKTKVNAREFFTTLAEIQFESGYPYIMFEDNVNRVNPVDGKVIMSNLCLTGDTEIVTDGGTETLFDLFQAQGSLEMGDSRIHGSALTVWQSRKGKYQSIDETGGEWSESTQVVRTQKNAHVYMIETEAGLSLKGTAEHKLAILGGHGSTKSFEYMTIGDIYPGVRLLVDTTLQEQNAEIDYEGNVAYTTVTRVSDAGYEDVYDITVPNGHSFVANGIISSNCHEILQPHEPSILDEAQNYLHTGKDISCNLGSLNIAKAVDGKNLGETVDVAIRALSSVSQMSEVTGAPSVDRGNKESRAIGLGQMNLHGFLAREHVMYGSDVALDFTNMYFYTIVYYALVASMNLAKETGQTFAGFEKSNYANGSYFDKYITGTWDFTTERGRELMDGHFIPGPSDWERLKKDVMEHGLYNQNLQAIPPTGSISYINGSTSSIHPIVSPIEIRKEGKIGRVYYPAPYLTDENLEYYVDAYTIGPEAIIDTYAVAQQHVDQGMSLTLFFKDSATTRDVNRAQIYAWKKGIKTLYYIRIRQAALEGTEVEGCVSCML